MCYRCYCTGRDVPFGFSAVSYDFNASMISISLLCFSSISFPVLCLLDFIWLLIMLVLTESSFLHAQKNNFPFETTKHSSEYREFLRSCCWGVSDLGSLRGLDLWNVSYPLVGCDTITHFVDNSDDVCRCNRDGIQPNLKAHPKLQTN